MFEFDEWLKPQVIDFLAVYPTVCFLLERFWDQLVIYLLTSPVQWLHMAHLIATTRFDRYGFAGRLLLMSYVLLILIFWEFVRIFVLRACQAVAAGANVPKMTSRMISAAKKSYEQAGPILAKVRERLSKKASSMLQKVVEGDRQAAGKVNKSPSHASASSSKRN